MILDTGGWLTALNGDEPHAQALEEASTLIVPGLVLAEVDYFLRRRRREMYRLLSEISDGIYSYEAPTAADLVRARELDRKFAKTDLGLVDASVAALAERLNILRVLTINSDFNVVRVGKHYRAALEVVGGPL
ncbi:MAG: PIN domain-containing protein [Myxococcaceae bacterium]|nr:PIN domain-containing protein [Myxococcaceae bacterium]